MTKTSARLIALGFAALRLRRNRQNRGGTVSFSPTAMPASS
jgi:hypothetical protein